MAGTLTVACKIPTGIKLRLYRFEEHDEPQFGGGYKTVKRAVLDRDGVKLNGPARFQGRDNPHEIRDGAGLTYGVDADFFNEWMKQNKDADYVKSGAVFAQTSKPGEVQAHAKDWQTRRTGLEPIDPTNLPAEFKGKIERAATA